MSVTDAKQWKGKGHEEVNLPSGNVCLARRPGIQVFMKAGLIPDSLTALVQKNISGDEAAEAFMADTGGDMSKLVEMFDMIDRCVRFIVVEPQVLPVPDEGVERDPEALYIDEVDMQDKMFLFNFAVGGTRDVQRFRNEQEELVERAQPGQDVQPAAE